MLQQYKSTFIISVRTAADWNKLEDNVVAALLSLQCPHHQ